MSETTAILTVVLRTMTQISADYDMAKSDRVVHVPLTPEQAALIELRQDEHIHAHYLEVPHA